MTISYSCQETFFLLILVLPLIKIFRVNSREVRRVVEEMIDESEVKPSTIRFFRGAMFNMVCQNFLSMRCIDDDYFIQLTQPLSLKITLKCLFASWFVKKRSILLFLKLMSLQNRADVHSPWLNGLKKGTAMCILKWKGESKTQMHHFRR